jgi:hypothetical protein
MSARGVKGKPKKRKPMTEPDNKTQSARFIESAKSLGADESGKDFERLLDKLMPKKSKPRA